MFITPNSVQAHNITTTTAKLKTPTIPPTLTPVLCESLSVVTSNGLGRAVEYDVAGLVITIPGLLEEASGEAVVNEVGV